MTSTLRRVRPPARAVTIVCCGAMSLRRLALRSASTGNGAASVRRMHRAYGGRHAVASRLWDRHAVASYNSAPIDEFGPRRHVVPTVVLAHGLVELHRVDLQCKRPRSEDVRARTHVARMWQAGRHIQAKAKHRHARTHAREHKTQTGGIDSTSCTSYRIACVSASIRAGADGGTSFSMSSGSTCSPGADARGG